MKIDDIVKQELWRSIATYFFFFIFFIYASTKEYVSIEAQSIFILAFFSTTIVFSFMVWYREKEQILNPSIFSIIFHTFESDSHEEKTVEPHENEKFDILSPIRKNIRLLILTILLYIAYLYASLAYHIDQIFWILVLLFTGSVLSKIIFGEGKADQKNPVRFIIFYVIACAFIFVRYLVLDYPVLPILQGSIIFGILLVILFSGLKLLHRKEHSGN